MRIKGWIAGGFSLRIWIVSEYGFSRNYLNLILAKAKTVFGFHHQPQLVAIDKYEPLIRIYNVEICFSAWYDERTNGLLSMCAKPRLIPSRR